MLFPDLKNRKLSVFLLSRPPDAVPAKPGHRPLARPSFRVVPNAG